MNRPNLNYVKQSNIFDEEYDILNAVGFLGNEKKMVYQKEILIDYHKKLMGYRVFEIPFIKFADGFKSEMQIFIRTIDNKILTFEMEHSNKIRDVRMKIKEKTKLSAEQQNLFYQGEILIDDDDDERTIGGFGICDGDVIDIVARLRGGMEIYFSTMDGKMFSFEFRKSYKIIAIKYKIQQKVGLHPDKYRLVYQGEILDDDDKTIDEYGISEKYVIDVVAELRCDGMQIFAKLVDGKTVTFEVRKSDKIINLKYKIYDKSGTHPDYQKLIYLNEILYDERTIDECRIHKESTIYVYFRWGGGGIKIFAKTLDGKTILLVVDISERIINIKKEIQDKLGLHPYKQILVFAGKQLDDKKTIDEYGICNGDVINVVERLKGDGIQIFIKTSDKSIIPINIVNTSRIVDVKSIIKEKTGIQLARNNKLIYKTDILLDDDKLLIDYQIEDGSVISIDVDSQFFMFMRAIKSGLLEKVVDLYDNEFHEMWNKLPLTSPMHYACKLNNPDIVKFLIKNNFNINVIDEEYNKPIHYACINNQVKILETLIQYKCSLEVPDSHGMKPIHLACLNGNFENVKLLIENRCDLESSDDKGRRPIHLACLAGNIYNVKLLIENKCEIDVLDKFNKSPFDIAEKENLIDIIDILNEEISRRMIENMIKELDLKCGANCDHKFCTTSLRDKTFNKGVIIKRGSVGKVYKCKLPQSIRQIAIKQILKSDTNSKNIEGNINNFIDKINHERIIKYFGAITKEENIFIFMEFMSGGSLKSQISTNPPMITSKVIQYTMQILEGLQFLHSNKIIHRDIKPDNILLDDDGNVKLTDLGLGLSLYTTGGGTAQANTFCGTTYYMAPEIINEEPYSYSADIWSLGVTVIEMATGMRPYHESVLTAVMYKIATTKTIPYQLPVSTPNKIKLLIDQMLIQEPSRRPSSTNLLDILKTTN